MVKRRRARARTLVRGAVAAPSRQRIGASRSPSLARVPMAAVIAPENSVRKNRQMLQSPRVVIAEPGRAELQEVPVDESAWGPNEVWIRTRYTLISAGTEGAAFVDATGDHRYPIRPGYAAVGKVIHEGSEFPEL